MPLVIECVVPADARDHLLAMLKEKVTEGIIFTKSVEVVKND
ncbi:MAG TPA: hypothetical protein DEP42_01975 [Ruminococcaceae bacterium]|nr:hypothetical protein [Oscillospiraceae bacterium]